MSPSGSSTFWLEKVGPRLTRVAHAKSQPGRGSGSPLARLAVPRQRVVRADRRSCRRRLRLGGEVAATAESRAVTGEAATNYNRSDIRALAVSFLALKVLYGGLVLGQRLRKLGGGRNNSPSVTLLSRMISFAL